MNAPDDRILSLVDADFARQLTFLTELVRLPTDNPPGDCAGHASAAAAWLRALDFDVEEHPVPKATVEAAGMVSATNLIARLRFGPGGPTIALNAHGDVVPPGAGWTQDPYGAQIVEDATHGPVMFGRGVAVSKSDFATYAFALRALRQLHADGLPLAGCVELHLTYDEETGGDIGPRWLLEQGLTRPDLAICAGFSYAVTTAHNGCLHLEVVVNGRQGHAAMPASGVDALHAASRILNALYDARAGFAQQQSSAPGIDHPTLNVGLIRGGINTNVVPDRVMLRIDRRMIPEENPAQAETALRDLIHDAVAGLPGIRLDLRRLLLALPLVKLPGADRLTRALQAHGAHYLGCDIAEHGVPLYTDARHYTTAGIPTVLYGAGPRTLAEANGHAADECLRLRDLRAATATVCATLAELLAP